MRYPLVSVKVQFYLFLPIGFASAALQNVTVDDGMLTGAVVPQYLPSNSVWNIGNACSTCTVKPDPSLAYNGTWHDATYIPSNPDRQVIEFTFAGSALYIFFIIANNVTGATTFTNVEFFLDGVFANTYTHSPLASADYQYNVPVYVNDSLSPGRHNIQIQPINTGNNVLLLFDYLIYTIDTSSSVSLSPSAATISSGTATSFPPPSATATGSLSPAPSGTESFSVLNIGAIIGGTVGGVAAIVSLIAFLLCYCRRKRNGNGRMPPAEGTVIEPYLLSREVVTALPGATSTHPMATVVGPASRIKAGLTPMIGQPSYPPTSTAATATTTPSVTVALHKQVELLRDEVARLRRLQGSTGTTAGVSRELPGYMGVP